MEKREWVCHVNRWGHLKLRSRTDRIHPNDYSKNLISGDWGPICKEISGNVAHDCFEYYKTFKFVLPRYYGQIMGPL